MQLVENVLGNSNDPAWKARLADATIDTLELSQWDAQKNRLRKDTRNGQAIAVSLDRNAFLHDGAASRSCPPISSSSAASSSDMPSATNTGQPVYRTASCTCPWR